MLKQEGVKEIYTLLYRPVKLSFNGDHFDSWVIGFTENGLGGPVHMKEGRGTPARGEIIVDDVDLLSPKTNINLMRRKIGMVFQSFNLYPHMTALANVTLALRRVPRPTRAH